MEPVLIVACLWPNRGKVVELPENIIFLRIRHFENLTFRNFDFLQIFGHFEISSFDFLKIKVFNIYL